MSPRQLDLASGRSMRRMRSTSVDYVFRGQLRLTTFRARSPSFSGRPLAPRRCRPTNDKESRWLAAAVTLCSGTEEHGRLLHCLATSSRVNLTVGNPQGRILGYLRRNGEEEELNQYGSTTIWCLRSSGEPQERNHPSWQQIWWICRQSKPPKGTPNRSSSILC